LTVDGFVKARYREGVGRERTSTKQIKAFSASVFKPQRGDIIIAKTKKADEPRRGDIKL
jgi:hypothetical protein